MCWKKNKAKFFLKIGMTLRRVTAVACDNSRRCYRKAAVGFRMLRDNPPRPAFTSFPSSFNYDVTCLCWLRNGRRVGVASVFAKATTRREQHKLRRASNKGTLRAFRNADRF